MKLPLFGAASAAAGVFSGASSAAAAAAAGVFAHLCTCRKFGA